MDKLSRILGQFTVSAGVFYSGQLCGLSSFDGPKSQTGHIHLLKQGRLEVIEPGKPPQILEGPALLFYPRPVAHQIKADDADNTEIVCASVLYGAGPDNPLASSLPSVVTVPLKGRDDRLGCAVEWLFEEAFSERCARQVVMDRLCEIMIIQLLRGVMEAGDVDGGMLAGLSHPQVSRAIDAIHNNPQKNWSLQELAEVSAMSRSRFAELFRETVGQPPGDYLTSWRIELAKALLKNDKPVGWVANEVGYDTASALARVFRKKNGVSPREWLNKY